MPYIASIAETRCSERLRAEVGVPGEMLGFFGDNHCSVPRLEDRRTGERGGGTRGGGGVAYMTRDVFLESRAEVRAIAR